MPDFPRNKIKARPISPMGPIKSHSNSAINCHTPKNAGLVPLRGPGLPLSVIVGIERDPRDETVAVCRQPVDCCQTLPPRWRLLSESTRPPPFLELSHPLRLVSQHQPPHGLQGPVAYVSATHNMIISKISTFCKSEMLSNRLFSISCDSAIYSPDHKAFSFVSETEGLNQAAATS